MNTPNRSSEKTVGPTVTLLKFRLIWAVGLAFVAGCMGLTGSRNTAPIGPAPSQTPTPADLISYLNNNAARFEGIESTDLALDIKGASGEGGVNGTLFCQKPKYLRLRAKALGKAVCDFGSNDREFWYWVSEDNPPYLYHCDYTDLARGGVKLPIPFQPDWVMETLGMATITPSDKFRFYRRGDTFELIESTFSSSSQPITKVTVFRAGNTAGTNNPQVIAHRLYDARNQLVAQATIEAVRRDDKGTGAVVPTKLKLEWPAQKMELQMKLDGLKIYGTPEIAQRNPQLFQRSTLQHLPAYDLARGTLNGQPTGLQRARGAMP